MTTNDAAIERLESGARARAEQRRAASWVTAAVSRHRMTSRSLVAATVVSDALDALGIENGVTTAAAVVSAAGETPARLFGRAASTHAGRDWLASRDPGDHAVVVSAESGLVLDAAFARFGTGADFLVATFDDGVVPLVHQVGDAAVRYIPTENLQELPAAERGLVFAQGVELAGVGSHVAFDHDVLVHARHPLLPHWETLREALDDVRGLGARRLAAFRTSRDDGLAALGYPWSLQDPYQAPTAMAVAA